MIEYIWFCIDDGFVDIFFMEKVWCEDFDSGCWGFVFDGVDDVCEVFSVVVVEIVLVNICDYYMF